MTDAEQVLAEHLETTKHLTHAAYLTWLKQDCRYTDPRPLANDRWAAIVPLVYTHAIVTGRMLDRTGYENRWCFDSYESAKKAMDEWDGTGEPYGWHRHPSTGRRRPDGDAALEYVAW
jgi:hypothetical protein